MPAVSLRLSICAALATLGSTSSTAAGQEVRSELVPTALVENGQPVELELVFHQPPGAGPFPTLIFNHGSTGSGADPAEFVKTWHSQTIGSFFNVRGWQVVFPQRRGRGRSGGLYDEGFTPNRSGYTCEPARALAGLERALEDLDEVVRHLRTRPSVDPRRLLAGGQSRGGILAIVHAGTRPGTFLGALNFVGGWMSDSCPNPTAINTVAFARGGAFPGPTAWLYGEHDPFYSLAHSRANHAAFTAAGGRGAFHAYNLGAGQNGHNVFLFPDRWGAVVDELLRTLPVPDAIAPPAHALANLSLRAALGGPPLIVGFVIGGETPRRMVLRGLGPALRSFGLTNVAEQPALTLFDHDSRALATIGAWNGRPDLAAAFAAAGAFPLAPGSADAAGIADLPAGAYTLHLADARATDQLILGEIFAVATNGLANLSARVALGAGAATPIAGFVVGGDAPVRLLVRVAGPALAAFGVSNAATDPQLAVYDATGRVVAANDNWSATPAGAAEVTAAAAQTGAFAFVTGSRDAATVLRLDPGAYGVHAPGAGVGLIELYSLPGAP